jgi:hypothetical protein
MLHGERAADCTHEPFPQRISAKQQLHASLIHFSDFARIGVLAQEFFVANLFSVRPRKLFKRTIVCTQIEQHI